MAAVASAANGPAAPLTNFSPIARSPSGGYVISGAVVHPAAGPDLLDATVVVDKGKIGHVLKGVLVENARTSVDSNTAKGVVLNDQGKMFVLAFPADPPLLNPAQLHLFPSII